MKLGLDADREDFRAALRSFFDSRGTEAVLRATDGQPDSMDRDTWRLMVEQLGLPGLAIPDDLGGSGQGLFELVIAFEEVGRSLQCTPLYATAALGATLVSGSGDDDACRRLLPELATGALVATVALDGLGATGDPVLSAERAGVGWVITGAQELVPWGQFAGAVFVIADSDAGPMLFEVPLSGCAVEALATVDLAARWARLDFSAAPAQPISAADAVAVYRRVLDIGSILLAATQIGGASATLELAVEYSRTREQFGRPVGSFQAIKHKCADLHVQIESARSCLYYAALAADDGSGELPLVTALAQLRCGAAFLAAAEECVLIHGAIGFTWEHTCHLYYRRARADALLFGDTAEVRLRVAEQIGLY